MPRTQYKMRTNTRKGVTAEHILLAEKVLGKPLPKGAVVHHADGNSFNNTLTNLVICPDRAYHNLLHARMRALAVCGHADWRKCSYCKEYDNPENMVIQKHYGRPIEGNSMMHKQCKLDYMKLYRQEKQNGIK